GVVARQPAPEAAVDAEGPTVERAEPLLGGTILHHHEFPVLRVAARRRLERQLDQAQHQRVVDRIGLQAADRALRPHRLLGRHREGGRGGGRRGARLEHGGASWARIKARPAAGGNRPAGSSITPRVSLDLRTRVAVVGVGCTPFGELYDKSPEDLLCDAVDEALADAGCERDRIEAAWVGTVMSTFGGDALADALKLFGRPTTVLRAPMIYSPLGLFDCCPTTDGAAAAVVCRADLVKSFTGTPVWPLGIGLAAVSGQPYYKPSFGYVGFEATVRAAEQAYAQAK